MTRLHALTPAPESWSNGFHYDPDSGQYVSKLMLHALGFGLQEFLQLLEFGG
jgi:hypothetical protein